MIPCRQFTATVYILQESHDADTSPFSYQTVLLHWHAKLGKWLPPGGHLEENETPPECAIREAFEETGIQVEILKEEHLIIDYPNARSIERPFLCLLENIPAHGSAPPHQHIDFIYVGRPIGGALTPQAVQETQARWFTLEEVFQLESEVEIFAETQQTIKKIFESSSLIFST